MASGERDGAAAAGEAHSDEKEGAGSGGVVVAVVGSRQVGASHVVFIVECSAGELQLPEALFVPRAARPLARLVTSTPPLTVLPGARVSWYRNGRAWAWRYVMANTHRRNNVAGGAEVFTV